ncbi:putative protein spg20 [Erysiphe neolycopersici]|uniref:Senescence domain-containing protein n=1 Tax=Erysiphe neolycopersici TaxID=212602 RepID=A0A420HYP6_9PEZI|nr:putative protein spg20 [Erysiphe neolycopersici]
MSSEPDLLYAIQGVNAYHVENQKEQLLTSKGPQTLSLFMTRTYTTPQDSLPREGPKLHLKISLFLDLELPANSRINIQPPQSYLIPRHDGTSGSKSVVRIEFPLESENKGIRDDIDTFEAILNQFNIIIEDSSSPPPQYDPSAYQAEDIKTPSNRDSQGQIMIVDENNGEIIGELGTGFRVIENAHLNPGSSGPVEITLPSDDSTHINVAPVSESYLEMAKHPVYKNSAIVSKAALASRFIVTASSQVTKTLQSQADSFTKKTKPNPKPLKFEPATQARIQKAYKLTEDAASLSSLAAGQVQKYAQNIGASMTKRSKSRTRASASLDENKNATYKPGLINKSLVAFSTIADGIDQAGRGLLSGTSTAVTTVVCHKYGPEAGEISRNIGGGVRNCGLIYIDATGVTRRAVLKSVVKGAVIGKLSDGSNVVVGSSGVYGENKEYYQKIDTLPSEPSTTSHQTNTEHRKEKETQNDKMDTSYSIPSPPDIGSSHHEPLPKYTVSPNISR